MRLYAPVAPFVQAIHEWERRQTVTHSGREITELARRANMSPRQLYRYTSGESDHIELRHADRLSMALGVPLPLLAEDFHPLPRTRRQAA